MKTFIDKLQEESNTLSDFTYPCMTCLKVVTAVIVNSQDIGYLEVQCSSCSRDHASETFSWFEKPIPGNRNYFCIEGEYTFIITKYSNGLKTIKYQFAIIDNILNFYLDGIKLAEYSIDVNLNEIINTIKNYNLLC